MEDISVGRRLARRHVAGAVTVLLFAGCGLGVAAAFGAAYGGAAAVSGTVWLTHSWLAVVGWALPFYLGLVAWLLPILKEAPPHLGKLQRWCPAGLVMAVVVLAAHPALERLGRPLVFLPAVGWMICLLASAGYAAMVWRIGLRSLRPSTADPGIQAGLAWLLVAIALRLIAALGSLLTGRQDFLGPSEPAVLLAATFGFVANTGLGLATALLTEFLRLPHARPRIRAFFNGYNGVLAAVVVGFMWCLPYPYSWGRLPLSACALALAYMLGQLLARLQLPSLLFARTQGPRQLLSRLALATGLCWLLLGGVVVAVAGGWIASLRAVPPAPLLRLAIHLVGAGFLTNLALALAAPLLGPRCLDGPRGALAWGAYGLNAAWVLATVSLTAVSLIQSQETPYEHALAGIGGGLGSLALAAWLVGGFAALDREAPEGTAATDRG